MKYARQTQEALNRLDASLKRLHGMVKRGEQTEALNYMENGQLKESYEELQDIITLSSTNPQLGAAGAHNIGNL
jgi:hypothetical protein